VRKARTELAEGQEHFRRRDYRPAREAWQRGLAMVNYLPSQSELAVELRGQLRLVECAEIAQELHHFVESIRVLYGADGQSTADLRAAEASCRTFWAKRDLIAERLGAGENTAEGKLVQNDLLDLAILWTDLRTRLAEDSEGEQVHRDALIVLNRAEALFGRSCVLDYERRARETVLGLAPLRADTEAPPRTAWEHYAVGRALFRSGKLDQAAGLFEKAVALEPGGLWPRYYQGACAYRRARHEDAVLAFTACIVLAPERAWCYYNRALAYDAAGQLDRALTDYDSALQLEPALAAASLNRGMIHYRAGRHSLALNDLERAKENGATPALVHYDQALIFLACGDRSSALESLNKSLKFDPKNPRARALASQLRRP
jgi:tetratricopeptide (TPR) repeat protein